MVSALLAGTGPVTIDGITVSQQNAVRFPLRDVYARFSKPQEVDAFTPNSVGQVFGRVALGKVDLARLVSAMAAPAQQRRLLVWSSRAEEEKQLSTLSIGGAVPDCPARSRWRWSTTAGGTSSMPISA